MSSRVAHGVTGYVSSSVGGSGCAGGAQPLGDVNPMLYQLAEAAASPGFRHISVGGNAISASSPAGYDMVTGLGTPNVQNLVKNILLARAGG
jgi:kumamolisin